MRCRFCAIVQSCTPQCSQRLPADDAIVEQHAHSLQRLGVSYVDSLVIHDLDLVRLTDILYCIYFYAV
jgi:aryl-alcohol dehydrogenase-like predicted oxidoreductase